MHSRQTFLHRRLLAYDRRGDAEGYAGGVLDVPVKACGPQPSEVPAASRARRDDEAIG